MMKLFRSTAFALLAVGIALPVSVRSAPVTNDWENLAVNSINRLPPRSYSMPLADEAAAFSDALEPETPYRILLNGTWKLSWAGNPDLRVKDFWRDGFDDSRWFDIEVPSCVELKGFGSPGYVNGRYPHSGKWPRILDVNNENPEYNPVSSYRTRFTVPAEWRGRDVILRFDGVYSAYYVWVNGRQVGYAEDSKLPSEFDVTAFLREGENELAVEVYRWCDGSFLEDQDMFRYSGIFRDVSIWAKPRDGIWDFVVKTTPVDGYENWDLELQLEQGGSAALFDAGRNKVGDLKPVGGGKLRLRLQPRLWSAEDPYLYTLVIRKGDDLRMRRVGFKEQKIVGNRLYVNGRLVKFKGVNRHECSVDNGRTVSLDEMITDITMFKRYNINTVRTCHYPDHHSWYDLCDRYGVYVIAEANVEGHGAGYKEGALGKFPEWDHSIVERNERQVVFYRNHPSVVMWSLGNETGHGDCFRHAADAVRALDSTRIVHWQRYNDVADIDSSMYPSVSWLEQRGKLGENEPGVNVGGHTAGKPYIACEYAHAMGNAIGNLQEYWEIFYRYPSLTGGCIWDWVDQAVWKSTGRLDPKTGCEERFLAYGGDFDERPNDGPFCCNGVVDPFRRVSAKLIEVAHVYRNLVTTLTANGLRLENRFSFTYADEFVGRWELLRDGVAVSSGELAVPHLAPGESADLALDLSWLGIGGEGEWLVNVSFATKRDTRWAPAGWVVARDQVRVGGEWKFASPLAAADGVAVIECDREVIVIAGPTKAVFSRATGTLSELTMAGATVLKDFGGIVAGPRFTCARAFVDNDIWLRDGDARRSGGYYSRGLTQLRYHARPLEVLGEGRIRSVVEVTGSKSAGFTHEATYSFDSEGRIRIENTVTPHGVMPAALARIGLSLKLDPALENLAYYGRGPRENYVDRCSGSFLGVWQSTVTEQFEYYVRPQDNGYKCDVRWLTLSAADGRGVRVSASVPMFTQALHYAADDLEDSRHRNGMHRFRAPLVPREEVCLNVDLRQLGLGGNSCGPRPIDKYRFPIQIERWDMYLEPTPYHPLR